MFSGGMPAAPNRSRTFSSTPQVIGLTKPSGGGGEYAVLTRSSWATKAGTFGFQFPITIRPPGRVTRTTSFATSNGLGANIAPKIETTRSKLSSARSFRSVASPHWKRRLARPSWSARAFPAATRFSAMSTPRTFAPSCASGTAVVPSPQPRSRTSRPGVTPRVATSASPLSRIASAIRVKSPFSQSALFGFTGGSVWVLTTSAPFASTRRDHLLLQTATQRPVSGTEHGASRAGQETGLDQQRHHERLGDRLAVEALDSEALRAAPLDKATNAPEPGPGARHVGLSRRDGRAADP